jgi:hypothetical protein
MESLRSSGDFNDLLSGFNVEEVRYLIIGFTSRKSPPTPRSGFG